MPNATKEYKKFLACKQTKVYAKALHFSNLCYLAFENSDAKAIKALGEIAKSTSSKLFEKIAKILVESSQDKLLDTKQVEAINLAKWCLLDQKPFARKLSTNAIIALGQDTELCRLATYRLIQLANPDCRLYLPHRLLELGVEQTSEQVAHIYKQANILPEELEQLAITPQNAQIIMQDIAEHAQRFGLIDIFVQKHPNMAQDVFESWRKLLSGNELSKGEREGLNLAIKSLQDEHSQFKALLKVKRNARSLLTNEEQTHQEGEQKNGTSLFSLIWGVLTGPQALVAVKTAGTASIGAAVWPVMLFVGPIIGANMLKSFSEENEKKMLNQEKLKQA